MATARTMTETAKAEATRRAGQRPRIQPAMASRRNAASSAVSASTPAEEAKSHTSQMTVAKIGAAVACFSTSIQAPGRGKWRIQSGMEREQQIGRGEAKCQRGEDGKGDGRALGQSKTDGRAHEGSGAGGRHHHGQHPGKKAAGITMARGQAGAGIGHGEPDLKHAGQRQAEKKEQQRHHRDKTRRLELEAPAQLTAPGPEPQQESHHGPEGDQNSQGIDQPVGADRVWSCREDSTRASPLMKRTGKTQGMRFKIMPPRKAKESKAQKLEEAGADAPAAAAGNAPGGAWISYAVPSPSRSTPFSCASWVRKFSSFLREISIPPSTACGRVEARHSRSGFDPGGKTGRWWQGGR